MTPEEHEFWNVLLDAGNILPLPFVLLDNEVWAGVAAPKELMPGPTPHGVPLVELPEGVQSKVASEADNASSVPADGDLPEIMAWRDDDEGGVVVEITLPVAVADDLFATWMHLYALHPGCAASIQHLLAFVGILADEVGRALYMEEDGGVHGSDA